MKKNPSLCELLGKPKFYTTETPGFVWTSKD